MSRGFVLFRLGERKFAAALEVVREIVRLDGLQPLPGATPPLAGTILLRRQPLAVLDIRGTDDARGGDVLVVDIDGETVGVAVDAVTAVLGPDELGAAEPAARALPAYVRGVRASADGPVLLVELSALVAATAASYADQKSFADQT